MRDLVGELGEAVREKGMKYAPSYHRERHSSYFAEEIFVVKSRALPDFAIIYLISGCKEIQHRKIAFSVYWVGNNKVRRVINI